MQQLENKLLRPKEVRELLGGIARSTLTKYRKKEEFPNPVKIDGTIGFWSDEVREFAESHRSSSGSDESE